jgi:hypothetical protein
MKIAGTVIPAIATTPANIFDLVALEKYTVQAILSKTIEEFRFASVNLAISTFALSGPFSCMTKSGQTSKLR